tara:strand:+ start:140 stop:520 length:381 start_codon:yes stop_codon:yes gene_type:complete
VDFSIIAISFLLGVLFHMFWNWLINTGYTIVIMKNTINDCIMFMVKNLRNVYEIKHLKEEAMRLAGHKEKYIEWQEKVDKREIESLKTMCIRNFISTIPPKYNHLIKFHDWDTAMQYIDEIIKEEK